MEQRKVIDGGYATLFFEDISKLSLKNSNFPMI